VRKEIARKIGTFPVYHPSRDAYEAGDAILVVIVLVIASIFAACMLVDYAANPGGLWHGLLHDRNVHFGAALKLTVALQHFNVPKFLGLSFTSRIWPPAADLSLALVMLVGGLDTRLAILPSLISWLGTMVLILLIARRLFSDRWTGNVAGMIAVTFALASTAFRLISADVRLEGPGAGLTAFCLYAYIRARTKIAGENERWWGLLAIGLTVLSWQCRTAMNNYTPQPRRPFVAP
jgi:4-amino-4-deoxy-L-arabinose transferase-like glycosyltransferase